jgi:hypothetical protein
MFFCFAFVASSINNVPVLSSPCQEPFFDRFQNECSDLDGHFCSWDEWICAGHGHHDSLSGACIGNKTACVIHINSKNGACMGKCVDNENVIPIITVVTISGIVIALLTVVLLCVCLTGCCCCCCGKWHVCGWQLCKWKQGTGNHLSSSGNVEYPGPMIEPLVGGPSASRWFTPEDAVPPTIDA